LADSNTNPQNGLLADAAIVAYGSPSGWYHFYGNWYKRAAGVFTNLTSPANAVLLDPVAAPIPFQLDVMVVISPATPATGSPGTGVFNVKGVLNGSDTNWFANLQGNVVGAIGMRYGQLASTSRIFVNRIQFRSRTSDAFGNGWGTDRFKQGGINAGPKSFVFPIGAMGQTHLDMIALASTFDGYDVRKNPGYGYKSDSIDYGSFDGGNLTGKDWSKSIVLEEGINIDPQDTQIGSVPEMLGADIRLNAIPGGNSGGSIVWGRIGAIGDPVLTDTVADVGIPGFELLVNYANSIQGRAVNPLQAKQIRVIRDESWLSVNNGAGPRELEYVTIYIPSLGVYRQVGKILGYDFVEGSGTQLVFLSQFPTIAVPAHKMGRIFRQLDYLGTTYKTR
jgi:hypothetical protein